MQLHCMPFVRKRPQTPSFIGKSAERPTLHVNPTPPPSLYSKEGSPLGRSAEILGRVLRGTARPRSGEWRRAHRSSEGRGWSSGWTLVGGAKGRSRAEGGWAGESVDCGVEAPVRDDDAEAATCDGDPETGKATGARRRRDTGRIRPVGVSSCAGCTFTEASAEGEDSGGGVRDGGGGADVLPAC